MPAAPRLPGAELGPSRRDIRAKACVPSQRQGPRGRGEVKVGTPPLPASGRAGGVNEIHDDSGAWGGGVLTTKQLESHSVTAHHRPQHRGMDRSVCFGFPSQGQKFQPPGVFLKRSQAISRNTTVHAHTQAPHNALRFPAASELNFIWGFTSC